MAADDFLLPAFVLELLVRFEPGEELDLEVLPTVSCPRTKKIMSPIRQSVRQRQMGGVA